MITKKISIPCLVLALGLLISATPLNAQRNPVRGPRSARHSMKSAAKKAFTQQELQEKVAAAARPSLYSFPMKISPTSTRSSIFPQTDLIPGATFRPHAKSLRGPASTHTFWGAENIFGDQVLQAAQRVTYTGTIFKDGDDIFGLVPTHALRWQTNNSLEELFAMASLSKKFELEVYNELGSATILRGEVVQLGSMQDISLIKFRPEDEKFLSPLSLRQEEITADTRLHIQGFNNLEPKLIHLAGLSVFRTTPTFMQVHLPGTLAQHSGLCGSPALDKNGQLAGVFIGPRSTETPGELDTGYLAPLSSIKTVVEAYRNGGKATFPLQLNNQTIMQLGTDEWVKQVYLFDEEGNFLWGSGPMKKFSYSQIEKQIKELFPTHIGLDVFKVSWSPAGELVSRPLKRVTYNFWEQRTTEYYGE
ncbi:MAG: hypothetical protein IKP06_01820 [Elusimicrobiaceae bacterium]|nr:hypothetical protein [Elusimicrobiaceae bacterium]